MITVDEMKGDYDWRNAWAYAGHRESTSEYLITPEPQVMAVDEDTSTNTFGLEDLDHLIGADWGINDERDWVCAGRLKDGRWFFLSAGCDYTGWGGSATVVASRTQLLTMGMRKEEAARMGLQGEREFLLLQQEKAP